MSLKSAHFSAGKYQVFLWQRVDKLYKIQENLPASCRFYLILTCTGQLRRKTAVDFRTHILYNLICHIRYAGRRAGLLRACTIQLGGNFMNGQKICILVDSGCDVPQAVRQAYDMRVLPLKIRYPEGEYDDQVNITAQQVYDRFPGEIPQTSLPDGGTIHDALDRARADGYEKALVICISSGLSGTYNMVRLVCQEYQSMETFVLDTRNISFGSGVFALLAAHWIAGGMDCKAVNANLSQESRC